MKKFLLALAAIAAWMAATPALAQKMPSANDAMRYDEARDPGYRAAVASGYVHGYGYGYGYGAGYGSYMGIGAAPSQDATCVQAIIVSYCSTHPERPQVGQTCSDPAGHLFALDANKRWYYVEGSANAMNVGQVVSRCPFSSYAATAAPPAPVVVAAPAAVPVASAAPSTFTYRDGDCLYTVTTFADGTHKVTKQFSPQ